MTISSRARDIACAGFAFTCSLLLYVSTLQPDFGGPEDTPKFQFIGYVLGIPHPPGYPLYVLLSHVFARLPLGTIAYRANLFSAVMAAVACALVFALARQLGARRWTASGAALGMATGASVWRSAVFAEVYSLGAVLAAAIVVLLVDWGHKGGTRRLVAAFGSFALALGNHLTVVGVAPAFALYVLTRGRRIWSARMIVASALLLLLGAGQYALIVVRTRQEAPYLETRADGVGDLAAVVTAERFAGQRFAFGPRQLLTDHLPGLASLIAREFGVLGTVLFVLGVAAGAGHADSRLVLGAAAGMFAMILNISGDLKGFITPLMVLLWPSVAIGLDRIVDMARRAAAPRAAIVALAATTVVPVVNVWSNYRDADQSSHTNDAAFLRGVFAHVPDDAGFVPDDYWSDMAWHYYRFTGEAGRHLRTARVPFSADAVREEMSRQRRVFALARGATFLAAEGLHFNRADVAGVPLDAWLRTLPNGSLVIGASAYDPALPDLSAVGHPQVRPLGRPRAFEAFAAIVGESGAAWRHTDQGSASLRADRDTLGVSLPSFAGTLTAEATDAAARVQLAGRTIASVGDGLALAAFTPAGALLRALAFPAGTLRRVPFAGSLYELVGESPCAELTTDRWTDVARLLRLGGWITTMRTVGRVTIEMNAPNVRNLRTRSTSLLGAGTIHTASQAETLTAELVRTGEDRPVFRLALDGTVTEARARVAPGGSQPSIRICAFEPVRPAIGAEGAEIFPDFESDPYFGGGWSDAERSPTGPVRTGEDGATLLLPFAATGDYRMALDLAGPGSPLLVVSLNGRAVGQCDLQSGRECELALPEGAMVQGVNRLTFSAASQGARDIRFTFGGARITRM